MTRRTDPETAYRRRWLTLPVLCLSLIVIGVDNTILNVALPTLAKPTSDGGVGASASELQWIVDAYTIVFAGLLLTSGSLSDRLGRYRSLTAGLVIFGVASVVSAFASTATTLIISRALLGIGASAIMPATLSILPNVFHDPKERAKAIGLWSGASAIGIGLGPTAGGVLLEHFWWGSVFLVNVPIVVVALIAGYYLVPDSKDATAKHLDPIGSVLSIAAVSVLLWGVIEGPSHGWLSGSVLAAFGIAVVLTAAFLGWERRYSHPMLDLQVFRNARFSAASAAITLGFFALFGLAFVLIQYMQEVLHYSAVQAGAAFIPQASVLLVLAPLSTRWVRLFGTKAVAASGMTVLTGGLVLMATLQANSSPWFVIGCTCVTSIGMANVTAPATESIMGSLSRAKAGTGSAMSNMTRQVGGAIGVGVFGSVLVSTYGSHVRDSLRGRVPDALIGKVDGSLGGALGVTQSDASSHPYAQAIVDAGNSGFVSGMHAAMLTGAAMAAIGALAVFKWLPPRTVAEPDGAQPDVVAAPSDQNALPA